MRSWVEELRGERQRLEQCILTPSCNAQQDTRRALEDTVLRLQERKGQLSAELQALAAEAADARSLQVSCHLLSCYCASNVGTHSQDSGCTFTAVAKALCALRSVRGTVFVYAE
jgi:hypothetical protein